MALYTCTHVYLILMTGVAVVTFAKPYVELQFTDCPSGNWHLDIKNRRCLLVVTPAMTYKAAADTCGQLGTQIAAISSDDDLDFLQSIITTTLGTTTTTPLSIWSKYRLVQKEDEFHISDEQGNVVDDSMVRGTLENNSTDLCVTSILNNGLERTRVDCLETRYFICEHQLSKDAVHSINASRLIALLISLVTCLAFAFMATFEIWYYLRGREAIDMEADTNDTIPIIQVKQQENMSPETTDCSSSQKF